MQRHLNLMTVNKIADTGLASRYALRLLMKQGKIPAIYIGKKALLDYDTVVEHLKKLAEENLSERG